MNFLQELKNIVDQHKINITEKELLDLLQNTKRWPLFYPWGQPTIEIINNLGRTSTDFYENINPSGPAYLDYEKNGINTMNLVIQPLYQIFLI